MKKAILFILLAPVLNSVFAQSAMLPESAYKCIQVSVDDFYSMMKLREDVIIIDVRLPAEFRPERIEHAVNIPVLKISDKTTWKLNKEDVILLYCTTDVRSCRAAVIFHELGFKEIYSLEGGIRRWKERGLPVVGRKHKKNSAERKDPPPR
jgi:rhodanese-related sulfurtransferase